MTVLSASTVSLRFFGEDLKQDEITRLLGHPPSKSEEKGEEIKGQATGNIRIARTGSWRLQSGRRKPGDLDGQICELLDQLTDSKDVWNDLAQRFRADIFCGLFMSEVNEGAILSAETLQKVSMRGLSIGFDIYDNSRR